MDIEGRSYYPAEKVVKHKAVKQSLRQLIDTAQFEVDGESNTDSLTATVEHFKLKRRANGASPKLNCVTLSNVDIDRQVLDAIEASLESIHHAPFYVHTSGGTRLYATEGYQQRLNNVVQAATTPAV